jgi:hypothetical protein
LTGPLLTGAVGTTTNWQDRLLAAHNRERSDVGVPALDWDEDLAASARNWADHLAATGAFYHAPERTIDPEGENLWAGTRGAYSIEAMVDAWAREERVFKMGRFPDNGTTGKVADVGHYTQLIWRNTGKVGCAIAAGSKEEFLVCRYSTAGNYRGDMPL